MTKKECLEKMVKVWGYLYENPEKLEVAAYTNLNLSHDLYDCPYCQYVSEKAWEFDCTLCPLFDLWPNGCDRMATTPYTLWKYTEDLDEKKAAAGEILDAAKAKLNEVE